MRTSTTIYNMICFMTKYLHTFVINMFGKSGMNLNPRRIQTSILHSKNRLEDGSRWCHLRNLWNNIILYITYTFVMTLRSFYGTRYLSILVVSIYATLTNIFIDPQISATLLLNYLINAPLAPKLRCPITPLAMIPIVLQHNHIKVSQFTLPYLEWSLMTVNGILSMN